MSAGCITLPLQRSKCGWWESNPQLLLSESSPSTNCGTSAFIGYWYDLVRRRGVEPPGSALSKQNVCQLHHVRKAKGVGLEPTTEWLPLLVFRTSSSSSRTPSMMAVVRGAEPPQDISPGRLATCCHTIRRHHQSGSARSRTETRGFGIRAAALTSRSRNAGGRTRTSESPPGTTGLQPAAIAAMRRRRKEYNSIVKDRRYEFPAP